MTYSKYFKDKEHILNELERLHKRKYELKEALERNKSNESFVVEFSGLPRTGKSTCIDKVYEFFKHANYKIEKTEEPAQIIKESLTREEMSKMTDLQFNDKTLEISRRELDSKLLLGGGYQNIIIQDRGVIDNYFWYQMLYEEGKIDNSLYEQLLLGLASDLMQVDQLFIMVAEPEIIIFRDYINQIWLEPRKKTTIERVTQLRLAFDRLIPIINTKMPNDNLVELDTSNMNEIETSIIIADKMMDGMSRKLIIK